MTVYAMHIEHQSPDQQTTTRLDPKRKRFGPPEPLYEVFRNRSETFHFYSFRTRNVPGPFLPISDPFRNISVTCLVASHAAHGAQAARVQHAELL